MKNTKRSAFTIVELVIVIAVIAILSAVLIPTFGAIIKDANITADQTAASTLTTELHVHLKGNTITNEAELMAAIGEDGADIADKLVPKSLGYGYHFWFNIETQMFVVDTAENIRDMEAVAQPVNETVTEGVALTAAVLTADTTANSAFYGVRDVFGNGYILADADNALSTMFGNFNDISNGASYATFMNGLADKMDDEIYGVIATAVYNNFKNITLRNNHGIFFVSGSTENVELIVPGTKILTSDIFVYVPGTATAEGSYQENPEGVVVPNPKDNIINIPSSVLVVESHALDYGTEKTVKVQTTCKDYNEIALVFTPKSTNSIILDTAGNQFIVTTGPSGGVANAETTDVLHTTEGVWKTDLVKKLPFEDYEIGYDLESNLVAENGEGENKVVYISYLKSGIVKLYAKSGDDISYSVEEWTSNNSAVTIKDGVLTFDYDGIIANSEAIITTKAYNINNVEITKTLKIVAVAPEQATVDVGKGLTFPLDGGTHNFTFYKNESNQTISPVVEGLTYNAAYKLRYDTDEKLVASAFTVSAPSSSKLVAVNNVLSFGGTGNGDYTFTVAIDGCLETTFVVNLIDEINALFQPSFHHSNENSETPYYIGTSEEVLISDLFNWKGTSTNSIPDFNTARVTIYSGVERGGIYDPINEINFRYDYTSDKIGAIYDTEISASEWATASVELKFKTGYAAADAAACDFTIVIAPDNGTAMYLDLTILDGATNVNNMADLDSLLTSTNGSITPNVVLNTDIIGTAANTVKLDIVDSTLYGNGYVLNPQGYTGTTMNDQFITLTGGKIDNIFIKGPVYSTLDFDQSTGYHVSGVESTGNSEIVNSYISNFRQPVSLVSGNLKLDNVTLRGGRYANMTVLGGTLALNDVTTIQDGANGVLGLGIIVEKSGMQANTANIIKVTGTFDQYNWVSNTNSTKNMMPTISANFTWTPYNSSATSARKNVKLGDVFGYLFAADTLGIDSIANFIVTDENGTQYLNTGIMYLEFGLGTKIASEVAINANFVNSPYDQLLNFPLFSKKTVGISVISMSLDEGISMLLNLGQYQSGKYSWNKSYIPLDVKMAIWGYSNTLVPSLDSTTDITYSGGYSTGNYASFYNN
ncbi:MAG: type II secretion system protein [Clostridia bacterium]|nr:type II secretion system protein [Clostridia bacterium]